MAKVELTLPYYPQVWQWPHKESEEFLPFLADLLKVNELAMAPAPKEYNGCAERTMLYSVPLTSPDYVVKAQVEARRSNNDTFELVRIVSSFGLHFGLVVGDREMEVGPDDRVFTIRVKEPNTPPVLVEDHSSLTRGRHLLVKFHDGEEHKGTAQIEPKGSTSRRPFLVVRPLASDDNDYRVFTPSNIKPGGRQNRAQQAGNPIITPENYQRIIGYLMAPESTFPNKRLLVIHPTGSGKTVTIWEVLNPYARHNDQLRYRMVLGRENERAGTNYSRFEKVGTSLDPHLDTTTPQTERPRKLIVIAPTQSVRDHIVNEAGKVGGYMCSVLNRSNAFLKILEAERNNEGLEGFACTQQTALSDVQKKLVESAVGFFTYVSAGNQMPYYENDDGGGGFLRHTSASIEHQTDLRESAMPMSQLIKKKTDEILLPRSVREDDDLFLNYNPFDHSVVCMDEFHNLINNKATQIQWRPSLRRLYYTLSQAKDCVLVGFTATPIVDTADDLRRSLQLLCQEDIPPDQFTVQEEGDNYGRLTVSAFRKAQGYLSVYSTASDVHLFPRMLPPRDASQGLAGRANRMYHPPEFECVPMSARMMDVFRKANRVRTVEQVTRLGAIPLEDHPVEHILSQNQRELGAKQTYGVLARTPTGEWMRARVATAYGQTSDIKTPNGEILVVSPDFYEEDGGFLMSGGMHKRGKVAWGKVKFVNRKLRTETLKEGQLVGWFENMSDKTPQWKGEVTEIYHDVRVYLRGWRKYQRILAGQDDDQDEPKSETMLDLGKTGDDDDEDDEANEANEANKEDTDDLSHITITNMDDLLPLHLKTVEQIPTTRYLQRFYSTIAVGDSRGLEYGPAQFSSKTLKTQEAILAKVLPPAVLERALEMNVSLHVVLTKWNLLAGTPYSVADGREDEPVLDARAHLRRAARAQDPGALQEIVEDAELPVKPMFTEAEYQKLVTPSSIRVKLGSDTVDLPKQFLPGVVKQVAPKLLSTLTNIANTRGKQLVFSADNATGLAAMANVLRSAGYEEWDMRQKPQTLVNARPKPRFILLNGHDRSHNRDLASKKEQQVIFDFFRGVKTNEGVDNKNAENKDGEYIQVALLMEREYSEGVDFKELRAIHLLTPPGDMRSYTQMIGRGIRNCSHMRLSYGMWTTKVFMYMSTFPAGTMSLDQIAHVGDGGDDEDAPVYRATRTYPITNPGPAALSVLYACPKVVDNRFVSPDQYMWLQALYAFRGPFATLQSAQRASVDCAANRARTLIEAFYCARPVMDVQTQLPQNPILIYTDSIAQALVDAGVQGCDFADPRLHETLRECFRKIMKPALVDRVTIAGSENAVSDAFEGVVRDYQAAVLNCMLAKLSRTILRCVPTSEVEWDELRGFLQKLAQEQRLELEEELTQAAEFDANFITEAFPFEQMVLFVLKKILKKGIPPLSNFKGRDARAKYMRMVKALVSSSSSPTQAQLQEPESGETHSNSEEEEGEKKDGGGGKEEEERGDDTGEPSNVVASTGQVVEQAMVAGTSFWSPHPVWKDLQVVIRTGFKKTQAHKMLNTIMTLFDLNGVSDIVQALGARDLISRSVKTAFLKIMKEQQDKDARQAQIQTAAALKVKAKQDMKAVREAAHRDRKAARGREEEAKRLVREAIRPENVVIPDGWTRGSTSKKDGSRRYYFRSPDNFRITSVPTLLAHIEVLQLIADGVRVNDIDTDLLTAADWGRHTEFLARLADDERKRAEKDLADRLKAEEREEEARVKQAVQEAERKRKHEEAQRRQDEKEVEQQAREAAKHVKAKEVEAAKAERLVQRHIEKEAQRARNEAAKAQAAEKKAREKLRKLEEESDPLWWRQDAESRALRERARERARTRVRERELEAKQAEAVLWRMDEVSREARKQARERAKERVRRFNDPTSPRRSAHVLEDDDSDTEDEVSIVDAQKQAEEQANVEPTPPRRSVQVLDDDDSDDDYEGEPLSIPTSALLPSGWRSIIRRHVNGKRQRLYISPDGTVYPYLKAARASLRSTERYMLLPRTGSQPAAGFPPGWTHRILVRTDGIMESTYISPGGDSFPGRESAVRFLRGAHDATRAVKGPRIDALGFPEGWLQQTVFRPTGKKETVQTDQTASTTHTKRRLKW